MLPRTRCRNYLRTIKRTCAHKLPRRNLSKSFPYNRPFITCVGTVAAAALPVATNGVEPIRTHKHRLCNKCLCVCACVRARVLVKASLPSPMPKMNYAAQRRTYCTPETEKTQSLRKGLRQGSDHIFLPASLSLCCASCVPFQQATSILQQ